MTSPLTPRHPRPCFTALPSVEKSQSTQALVHVRPPSDDNDGGGGGGGGGGGTTEREKSPKAGEATFDSVSGGVFVDVDVEVASAKDTSTASAGAAFVDSLSHSLIKGARSASCSNVPDKSLSECPAAPGGGGGGGGRSPNAVVVVDSINKSLRGKSSGTSSTTPVRPKDRQSTSSTTTSRLSASSLACLKSKTAAAASPPKSNISVDSAIHMEMRKMGSPSSSSPSSAKESGNSSSSSSSSTFSFMPSAVIKKLPAVFGKGSGSPGGRKRNAMKPTPSQHKALAELASNGELQLLPCNTLNGTQSKVEPKLIRGFLAQTYQYARQRIPTLNEFCEYGERERRETESENEK